MFSLAGMTMTALKESQMHNTFFLYSFDPRLILAVGFFCFCIDWYLKSIALHLIL